LTQGFFLYACEHNTLQKAERRKGRFRTFVLACLKGFLNGEHRSRTAVKRGGAQSPIQFDGLDAATRYAAEPVDDLSPDKVFERKLALEILDGALKELQSEAAEEVGPRSSRRCVSV
jgi:RNA polymerase sigma-70 factor (ECF subfamily)